MNLFIPQERSPTPLYYPQIISRGYQPSRLYYEDVTNIHDQISHPLTSSNHGFHHPTNTYHLNDQVHIYMSLIIFSTSTSAFDFV